MKTAFVTGATGFIGANIVRELLKSGRHVKALVRNNSNLTNLNGLDVELHRGDLRDFDSIKNGVEGCDEVYHVAAEYSFWAENPSLFYKSNVEGTANVMQACLDSDKNPKVVYTSTVGTIGLKDSPQPCHEFSPMLSSQLANHYKSSKFEAEKRALEFIKKGVQGVIVNPAAPIGAYDVKPTPTGKIIVDFLNGQMPAFLNTGLCFVNVKDVAKGHVLAAEKGEIGERYILGNQNMSLQDFLSLLSKKTKLAEPKIKIPYEIAYGVGYVSTKLSDWLTKRPPLVALEAVKMAKYFMYFDSARAIHELGYQPSPIETAVEEAISWFLREGYISNRKILREVAL